jgi:hypothetical protein
MESQKERPRRKQNGNHRNQLDNSRCRERNRNWWYNIWWYNDIMLNEMIRNFRMNPVRIVRYFTGDSRIRKTRLNGIAIIKNEEGSCSKMRDNVSPKATIFTMEAIAIPIHRVLERWTERERGSKKQKILTDSKSMVEGIWSRMRRSGKSKNTEKEPWVNRNVDKLKKMKRREKEEKSQETNGGRQREKETRAETDNNVDSNIWGNPKTQENDRKSKKTNNPTTERGIQNTVVRFEDSSDGGGLDRIKGRKNKRTGVLKRDTIDPILRNGRK